MDTRFILARAECPYVQSIAARVISTEKWFVIGVQTVERGIGPKSLMEGSKGCQEPGSSLTVCDVRCVVRQKFVPLLEEVHPLL